jgi:hypothetical protein
MKPAGRVRIRNMLGSRASAPQTRVAGRQAIRSHLGVEAHYETLIGSCERGPSSLRRIRGEEGFVKQKSIKSSEIRECYSRAAEARRLANVAATPAERADLLEIAQRWLALARDQKSIKRAPRTGKPSRE